MVQRYRTREERAADNAPQEPPDFDQDDWDDEFDERPRRGLGFLSVAVVVVAMLVGLVVFSVLTGIGNRLMGLPGLPVAATVAAKGTATVTVGAQAVAQQQGTPTPAPTPGPTRIPAPSAAADVPSPPNSELVSMTTEQQSPGVTRANARYQSSDQQASIQQFYDEELPRRGWIRTTGPTNGFTSYSKTENGLTRSVAIQLTAAGAGTQITMQVTLPRDK